MAEDCPEPFPFRVEGHPLRKLGLDGATVRLADGSEVPFTGFVCIPGKSIKESIEASLPEGATLLGAKR